MTSSERHPGIVYPEMLASLSGLRQHSRIAAWCKARGIAILDGKDGPWTTLDAINSALGVRDGKKADDSPAF